MKTLTTRALALAGALAISLGATACSKSDAPATGSSSSTGATPGTTPTATSQDTRAPKPADLLQDAKANALAATSAAFVGEITQNGELMKIDFKGTSDGKTADISLQMSSIGKVHLISVPGSLYMQGDASFWKAQGAPASVQKAGDKFVKAPADAAAMADSLSLRSFLKEAFGAITPQQLSDTVGEESVNGVPCWVLTDRKGKAEGMLYVSKDRSEVVRFTGSKDSPGQLDFSRWNEDLGITAPSASQILPIN
ncbi:hypothetical protein N865_21045 [Intrasporangium oryzae NRRL B-24470]|uniref:Lipoprotein n=1 Tax=Intrasporangium oryzae NRRL B-24470 TaxID=1386089 RepID=W9G0W9_9MICO|nr:hypothetical protein [Intrasporangium oryzae]EWS99735.1 hypothetical protein N865_21045 [Intrasporangium oryzae NRRL B-24470]